MRKLLLIDGNSVLFRAYYATLSRGMMTTINGIPTNAAYGFITMMNKVLEKFQPDHVIVAWDSGKPTFRHELYKEYKGTRKKPDQELIVQFSIVREYLDAYGIFRYEQDGIEADDIIGSINQQFTNFETSILTGDKDLLQLIQPHTSVYLMKKGISEMDYMNAEQLQEKMGITPAQIIDLKSLMGDASDNIPGVLGVGEKTALKLLDEYQTVDNVYTHLDEIKGKLQEKLSTHRQEAFLSKQLATIKIDEEFTFVEDDFIFQEPKQELYDFFIKYDMNSFAQKMRKAKEVTETIDFTIVSTISASLLNKGMTIWADYDNENYYDSELYGFAICNDSKVEYISLEDVKQDQSFLTFINMNDDIIVSGAKNLYHHFNRHDIASKDFIFDIEIAAFLVDNKIIDYERFMEKYNLPMDIDKDHIYGKKGRKQFPDFEEQVKFCATQSYYIYQVAPKIKQELQEKGMLELFQQIEMPLTKILFKMEASGVSTNEQTLHDIAKETEKKIANIGKQIYEMVGIEFNINSPKQLGNILFDELGLKGSGKKRSTAVDVLEKLRHTHPIIPLLLEHRKYQKIYSTYAVGLSKHIQADGKIHTIFNQTQTQTGRLSSSDPALQNISVKDEEGKEIRKAFIASGNGLLLSADYSQIELRVLAHMANEKHMIDAFIHNEDIHTKTAMQIYDVSADQVTLSMRRGAKTVNFGIVYGQTDYGLSEQLGISRKEAHQFIEKYFAIYPSIKIFMDEMIAFCEKNGYVSTLLHRRRYIDEIHDKDYRTREFGKRAAMNAPIQGSAADLIKVAMIHIDKAMMEAKVTSKMILQIHDELIFDVVKEEQEKMKQLVEEGMQKAMKLKVPLVAEAKFGRNWYDAK